MNVVNRMSDIASIDAAATKFYAVDIAPMPGLSLFARPGWGSQFTPYGSTRGKQDIGFVDHTVIRLSNVDLSSIHVRPFIVHSAEPQDSALGIMAFGGKKVSIATTDSNLAERVSKALRHAATSCGAKSSGF